MAVGVAIDLRQKIRWYCDIDSHACRHRHENGDCLPVFRIRHYLFETAWSRDSLTIFDQAGYVKYERPLGHPAGLVHRSAGRDAARKVRERDAVGAAGLFMNKRD